MIVLLQGGFVCGLARGARAARAPCSRSGIAGTAATFGLVALAAHALVGLDWTQALLLGAVLSPTDPAAVFAAVSRAGAGGARIVRLLEAEAGFNDPVAIALTLALVGRRGQRRDRRVVDRVDDGARARARQPWWGSPRASSRRACSVRAGRRSRWRRRSRCSRAGSRRSALGALAHGSGFVAVYLYGLVLGDDADLPQADAVRAFGEQLASLAEIAMFVLLGVALAQVPLRACAASTPRCSRSRSWSSCARCSSTRSLRALRRTHGEAVFATVGGLKGAVPILLAALPLQAGLDGSDRIFALAGLVVLASLALQGPAVARLAPRLALDSAP